MQVAAASLMYVKAPRNSAVNTHRHKLLQGLHQLLRYLYLLRTLG